MAFEGRSEIAFGAWLQDLCDENGLNVYLDRPGRMSGGDPLALVHCSLKLRQRSEQLSRIKYRSSCLLIDADRLEDQSARSREAITLAGRKQLTLIRQRPCFEAVLLRLHTDHENDFPFSPRDAEQRLRRLWAEYEKPPTKIQIASRFKLEDLRRAAEIDSEIDALLRFIGLR